MASNVALSGLAQALWLRKVNNNPIKVGLVGCGEMGTDLLCRIALMDGIKITHIVTRNLERVFEAGKICFNDKNFAQECNNLSSVYRAIEIGKVAASTDLKLLLENEQIDIVVDATGHPNAGAEIGYKVLTNGKHLVTMNLEADAAIGIILNIEAINNNLIYSLGAGDEPSACMELINFISSMGHEIVAAGKGKNNPLIIDATPDKFEEEAHKRNMNPRMLVEFIDGSKTMVEMAAISNATGLKLDIDGMHGTNTSLEDLNKVFIPKNAGGILNKNGIVDYTIGKNVAPGVFAIAYMPQPRIRERMSDLKLGDGPYYTFYRPYHLTAMEVPLTCARIVLTGQADMQPLNRMITEVCAVAKKDLNPGDKLDFIGLYTYRAYSMDANKARDKKAIACGLLEGAIVTKSIKKGELFTEHNSQINSSLFIAKLRASQNKLLYK